MPLSAPAPRASSKQIRISTLETERGREAILGLVKTGHSQRTGCLLEGCLCSLIPLDSICREEGRNSRRRTRRIKRRGNLIKENRRVSVQFWRLCQHFDTLTFWNANMELGHSSLYMISGTTLKCLPVKPAGYINDSRQQFFRMSYANKICLKLRRRKIHSIS